MTPVSYAVTTVTLYNVPYLQSLLLLVGHNSSNKINFGFSTIILAAFFNLVLNFEDIFFALVFQLLGVVQL